MTRLLTAMLALAFALTLFAHGDEEHIIGTVKAVTTNSVTVETTKHETVMVRFTPKMEVTKSKVKANIADLKVGDRVVIHAMKNKDGKYEAHEVSWGATSSAVSTH